MPDHPSTCRLCGASHLECLGSVPANDFFAGRVLREPLPGGRLWRCLDCESIFRHPILSADEYRRLYENGAAGQWFGDGKRRDLAVVRSLVLGFPGVSRVLDVGCGGGDFLSSLPATMQRFGVEPSVGAATEAGKRGIRIAAALLELLPADARFDVITIIDVIEHVADPGALLEKAFAHLADGGFAIVSTGNPQAFVWRRVFRARFWYSSFPEHITFPSRRFYEHWARSHGGELVSVTTTRYRGLTPWMAAVFFIIQLAYWVHPRLLDWVGRLFGAVTRAPAPRRQNFAPGVDGLFVDHWVLAIRRTR